MEEARVQKEAFEASNKDKIDENNVPQAMKIIADLASLRTNFIPATYNGTVIPSSFAEVQAGGFQSFVLNVAHFEQV